MNELIKIGTEQTMSSKDITILLNEGKPKEERVRHDNVKRTMERLQDRGVISFTPMEEMIEVGKGAKRVIEVYHVNEDNSIITVAQLSPEFTAAIVKEWRRLKGENADLKALVIAQGRKIDALADKLLEMVPVSKCAVDVPQSATKKEHGRRGVPITKHEVKQIKLFADKGKVKDEIADLTGFSRRTVYKVLKGERDYLLKA